MVAWKNLRFVLQHGSPKASRHVSLRAKDAQREWKGQKHSGFDPPYTRVLRSVVPSPSASLGAGFSN
jgi:hypothetical protein